MAKVYVVKFTTDGETPDGLKDKLSKEIDRAFIEDSEEDKRIDNFIVSLAEVVKTIVGDGLHDSIDEWATNMCGKSLLCKRSFYACYSKALLDVADDVACLAEEHRWLNSGKETKSKAKKK